jgi:hypothetical protein
VGSTRWVLGSDLCFSLDDRSTHKISGPPRDSGPVGRARRGLLFGRHLVNNPG